MASGLALLVLGARVHAASIDVPGCRRSWIAWPTGPPGRIGACVADATTTACVNGDQRSSLQSVMKLVVAVAVLEAVDADRWPLDEPVTVRREDLSVGVQPIAKLVGATGFRTTIGDLVRRAVVDSDSAATDVLIARLGGPKSVQAVLERHRIAGVRVDRDERHLQTETQGLEWRPEYVDPEVLDRDLDALPKARREAAFRQVPGRRARHRDPSGHGVAPASAGRRPAALAGFHQVSAAGHERDRDLSRPPEGRAFAGLDARAQDRQQRPTSGEWPSRPTTWAS